ncbi:MAG: S8 family serine peptidase [Planctomycetota bacterium]|jgi:subtilisin family serine protease
MSDPSIISPAFRPFLEDASPNEVRKAIVVYRAPEKQPPVRGRLKKLKRRLDYVKARAAEQRPLEAQVFAGYQRAFAKHHKAKDRREPIHRQIGTSELPVFATEVTAKSLSDLAEQPDVLAVLPNQKIELIRPREINYSALGRYEARHKMTWGLRQLEIPKMWETTKGADINVAVLDTGVHGGHPALARTARASKVRDFIVVDPLGTPITASPVFDGSQHGTHVCGTIAGGVDGDGVAIGVAPEANLLVGAVLLGDATVETLLQGISWAVEKGADVINMSLGFTYYEPLFAVILNVLIQQYGVLPVAAIGNENHGNTSSPGNAYSALAVGAAEKMPRRKISVPYFSGGASLEFPGEEPDRVTKPDVVAPGVQVWSCVPPEDPQQPHAYAYMDGSSMATPHVAGVAALLMAAKPNAPVADIIEVLKETAKHPTGQRPDNRWGHGMIRPIEALEALQS